jgi:Fe2+ or Zn2+ uptake regulation protein
MLTESKLLERISACTLAGETTLTGLSDHFEVDPAVVWSMLRRLMDSGLVKEIADDPSAAPHYANTRHPPRQSEISYHCSECGNAVTDFCDVHPNAQIDSVINKTAT